jgi:hypothetical protein
MRLPSEPSQTEVKGLTMSIDYLRAEGIWSATLRHPNLGSYTAQGFTPTMARERARQQVAEKFESLMFGHEQKHAHEIR